MTTRILFIALSLAWVIVFAGLVWMMDLGGLHPRHLLSLLIHLDFMSKGFAFLSLVFAAIGIIRTHGTARSRLAVGVGGALGWGVLGALYGVAGARSMLISMNPPIPFAIYAPAYAEALIVLLVGASAALLCLGVVRKRR